MHLVETLVRFERVSDLGKVCLTEQRLFDGTFEDLLETLVHGVAHKEAATLELKLRHDVTGQRNGI